MMKNKPVEYYANWNWRKKKPSDYVLSKVCPLCKKIRKIQYTKKKDFSVYYKWVLIQKVIRFICKDWCDVTYR